jgi:hypothetical protein
VVRLGNRSEKTNDFVVWSLWRRDSI